MLRFGQGKRRVAFRFVLEIHELSNFPWTGEVFIKWKDTNKNKGTTDLHQVGLNHSVPFNESFEFTRTLNVTQSTNMVESCIVRFSIRQLRPGANSYREVGVVTVDLSHYLKTPERSRKYLLQKSKSNCSLHITVKSRQIEGDPMFCIPVDATEDTESDGPQLPQSILARQPAGPSKNRHSSPHIFQRPSTADDVKDDSSAGETPRASSLPPEHTYMPFAHDADELIDILGFNSSYSLPSDLPAVRIRTAPQHRPVAAAVEEKCADRP